MGTGGLVNKWYLLHSKQKQIVRKCHGPRVAVKQVLCMDVKVFFVLCFKKKFRVKAELTAEYR